MSLEAILSAIETGGREEAGALVQQAQSEAAAIIEAAQREAQRVQQDARERAVTPAYRERARILHRARLEALRTVGDARETAIDAILAQARIILSQMRSTPAYPRTLRRLTEESLAELERSLEDRGAARLEIDARDEALMAEIIRSLNLQLPLSCTLQCWGGLVASSQDGRIVVINTLESRLDRALPFLRRDLAALLENGGALRPNLTTEMLAYGQ